jgi:D-arabinitol 4-dehydrogenase
VFMQRWAQNQLPYEYQDGILDSQAVKQMFSAKDPIAEYAHDSKLFGELASKPEFETLLRESIAGVYQWLESAKQG